MLLAAYFYVTKGNDPREERNFSTLYFYTTFEKKTKCEDKNIIKLGENVSCQLLVA
jgi:hypothetical protein